MAAVNLAPHPIVGPLFIPGGNVVASGAQLFTYAAGTSTKQTTFTTSSGTVARTNPIVLDSSGNIPGSREIWLSAGVLYDLVLAPSTDTDPPGSPYWTIQNVSGVNDLQTALTEWIPSGSTATFTSPTSFSLSGDQTGTFSVSRRIKTSNTAGTVYSTVSSSVFSSSTAIGVTNDSPGALDSGLNALFFGLIPPTSNSLPRGDYTMSTVTAINFIGLVSAIGYVLDGGGVALTTGVKGDLSIPFGCSINSATLQADQSGSLVVDIWKKAYSSSAPTSTNSITASALPTLSSAQSSQDSTLTGWTKAISANDILRFNINSASTCTRATLTLKATRT